VITTAPTATISRAGLVVRESDPLNLECPFDQLGDFLTPNDLFYVRSHFPAPVLDAASYTLNVLGAVARPLSISWEEVLRMPSITRAVTLECAGNGRAFLSPQARGVQWQLGAVGTAEWTGVSLSDVLDRAGLLDGVCEIGLEAADKGILRGPSAPPRETPYARSIPHEKACDVLLAYAMNGEPISPEHGFPLRAIVPGYYAMASVKWLTRIRAMSERASYYWQTADYSYWDHVDGNPVRRPLFDLQLKSAIARPRAMETLKAGSTYTVFGAAWGGKATPDTVEFSVDDGQTWRPAEWLDPAQPSVWRRWHCLWKVPKRIGLYSLKQRARTRMGEIQPAEHDPCFNSYVIHHTLDIRVVVR
jgi:DMSO/TMAO reductase YedYZ molybdopterin-dependent catalytic subunit